MSDPILDVRDLSVSFRVRRRPFRAVDRVSFSLRKGETLALVGESGCGKSVTALALLRLIPDPPGRIEGGSVLLGGRDLLALPAGELQGVRGREIAMVFQEPMTSLNPVFTAGSQIAEAVRAHRKVSRKEARAHAIAAMKKVQIPAPEDRYGRYPHEMSGGMRQRIMIAMALACSPSVLVADEPTTALDVTIQAQILELIKDLQREADMGVVLITHDLGIVAEVADRVLIMYAGVVVESADVRELFANPLHPYTKALYRSLPSVASAPQARLESIPGRVPPLEEVPPYCRFYDRCPLAADLCRVGEPELRELRPGHSVRCVRA